MRKIFDVVCPLGDALILARRNPWHDTNKTIVNEFQSQWERAIILVYEKEMDGFLSDYVAASNVAACHWFSSQYSLQERHYRSAVFLFLKVNLLQ